MMKKNPALSVSSVLSPVHNFLGLSESLSSYDVSEMVVLPCPLELSTSYGKGAASGPAAILKASHQVEFFDEETELNVSRHGIATQAPQEYAGMDAASAVQRIQSSVGRLLDDGKFPVVLGGEHTVTVGVIGAYVERKKLFSVLQLDAHSDLRDTYEGDPLSHACALRRVHDMGVHHVGVGIRSQCEEERRFAGEHQIDLFYAHQLHSSPDWERVIALLQEEVYVTIDVDVFDPSVMPSTGTPEPGGLTFPQVCDLLRRLTRQRRLIGLDIVELAPIEGLHYADFTAARLLYKIMGYRYAQNTSQ
jgi:agmatinase